MNDSLRTGKRRGYMRVEPWLNPGAIEFLRAFTVEHQGCDVLEFGGGASTIWFLRQGCQVVSFESNQSWYEYIESAAANRDIVSEGQAARLDLRWWHDDISERLNALFEPESFDVVLVDGVKQYRPVCLHSAAPLVRAGGVLMRDDGTHDNLFPDWDFTLSVQGTRDKFNASRPRWTRGRTTVWWRKPAPLPPAEYYEVWSTR